MGGSTCSVSVNVNTNQGQATLTCNGTTTSGTLVANTTASGVSFTIPYTAGNGGPYAAQSITPTGVAGLTASIAAGNFNNGSGSLTYTVSGQPTSAGTASFAVNIGGSTCTVNLTVIAGYNLSKLKILSVGLAPWGIDSSVNSGLGVVMENPYIFSSYYPGGSNTAAPFQTIGNWDITRRSVASGGINDLNNSGYKLLLVGYTYDITASEIASVQAFVNNGGTVIWYSEVNSVNTANLVRTYVGQGATMSALSDCYANNTGSSILVGDFGDARFMKYGNDACNPKSWSGVNFNLIEPLSFSPTNQNIVGFKSKTSEFYWFGDGGMTFYSGGVPPVSGTRYPWLLDGGQIPVIGTWNNQTNISNSVMMMNIIVKAMKAAQ